MISDTKPVVWTCCLSIDRLLIGSRSVLTSSVLSIAPEISSCLAKVFCTKFYGPLPSMLLLPTDCLSLDLLQDGPRSDLCCFSHELAVEISCCVQYVIDPNFLLAHFTKIRLLRPEYWIMIACRGVDRSLQVATCWSLCCDRLLRCDLYFLICSGRINVDSFFRSSIGDTKVSKGWISRGKSRNSASSWIIKSNCRRRT